MAIVTIYSIPQNLFAEVMTANFRGDVAFLQTVKKCFPQYTQGCAVASFMEGVEAAEEAFDVTNNPMREDERLRLYGNARSVSVGDVVNVTTHDQEENFVCLSSGWARI